MVDPRVENLTLNQSTSVCRTFLVPLEDILGLVAWGAVFFFFILVWHCSSHLACFSHRGTDGTVGGGTFLSKAGGVGFRSQAQVVYLIWVGYSLLLKHPGLPLLHSESVSLLSLCSSWWFSSYQLLAIGLGLLFSW